MGRVGRHRVGSCGRGLGGRQQRLWLWCLPAFMNPLMYLTPMLVVRLICPFARPAKATKLTRYDWETITLQVRLWNWRAFHLSTPSSAYA
jgi:hypothetical protein